MRFQFIILLSLFFSVIVLGGCQKQQSSLSKENLYSIYKVDSKTVKILWADVYERKGQIVVLGTFRRIGHSNTPVKTHIDVQVVSADGELLYENKAKEMSIPGRYIGNNVGCKRFSIILPGQPSRNSEIRLICHAGSHE